LTWGFEKLKVDDEPEEQEETKNKKKTLDE
jgi:hypothetical protein